MEKNISNWFEIPSKDFERAKNFYSKAFQVELIEMPSPAMKIAAFPMVQGGEYSTGAIVYSEMQAPSSSGSTVYLTCDDVSKQLSRIESLGGKTMLPKTSIGEFGFIGHFIDSEGNKVGLHSVK